MRFLAPLLLGVMVHATTLTASEYHWTTLAGNSIQDWSSADGIGEEAVFQRLTALTVDAAGNIYGMDQYNLRKITPDGAVITIAGNSTNALKDGIGTAASFGPAEAIAAAPDGTVFVADTQWHRIRKVSPDGTVTTLAGRDHAGGTDGYLSEATFSFPRGIALAADGSLYVSSASTIRKISPAGFVSTVAGVYGLSDYADGQGTSARFRTPRGLVVDPHGTLSIADAGNHAIRKMAPDGTVTTLAGIDFPNSPGTADGFGTAARFSSPSSLTITADGTLYVADRGSRRVRKVTAGGMVTTMNGPGFTLGTLQAVVVDPNGTLLVSSDTTLHRLNPLGALVPVAGAGHRGSIVGDVDGPGPSARFNYPNGIGVDPEGNAYVGDQHNHKIRKITPDGWVTSPASPNQVSQLLMPQGTAVLGTSPVYVASRGNNRIFAMDAQGMYSLVAGSIAGVADGTGAAARFRSPTDVAVAPGGLLYVADMDNHTIRKITAGGVVTTFAGSPGQPGTNDGTGSQARFNQPSAVAVDSGGNIYVADHQNFTIRKITPAGTVTTLAGMPGVSGTRDGVGSEARFARPQGVAIDLQDNVIVADSLQHTIRRVTPSGVVTTIGGQSQQSGLRDGYGAEARFFEPTAVAVAPDGRILVTDRLNQRVAVGGPFPATAPDLAVNVAYGPDLANGDPLDFGGAWLGGGIEKTIILRNFGATDLTGVTASIVGPNAAEFSVVTLPPTTIPGLAGRTAFPVHFKPIQAGPKSAVLRITSDDPAANPFDVALSGIGTPLTAQPADLVLTQPGPASFQVQAEGINLTYQWFKDGIEIPGQTESQLIIAGTPAQPSTHPWHIGDYAVRVSNNVTTTMSAAASLDIAGIPAGVWRGLVSYYPFDATPDDLSRPNRPAGLWNDTSLITDPVQGGVARVMGKGYAIPPLPGEPNNQLGPGGFIQIPTPLPSANAPFSVAFAIKEDGYTLWHGESLVTLGERTASLDLLGHYWIGGLSDTVEFYGSTNQSAFLAESEFVLHGSAVSLGLPWTTYILVVEPPQTRIYRNGTLAGTLPYTSSPLGDFFIGRHWWDEGASYSTRLIGKVDEFRVYNRPLSQSDVLQLSSVIMPDPLAYQSWATDYGLSGNQAEASADPDADNHTNWAEFSFGTHPMESSPAHLQVVSNEQGMTIEWLERPGIRYLLQSTTDLGASWTTSPLVPVSLPGIDGLPAGYWRVRVEIPLPAAGDPATFFRVLATAIP